MHGFHVPETGLEGQGCLLLPHVGQITPAGGKLILK
jgi:hypothetical protein